MLLRSNNVIDPHELSAKAFKLLAASIAIMLTAGEAVVPAEVKAGEESADWMHARSVWR